MSLEATHIRFALDLKDKFQVKDIEKYLAGTIYPDSRYVTQIDRELTHNEDILDPHFAKDDFRKGWQAHQLCDIMQNRMKKRAMSEPFLKKYHGFDEARWVASTAMKIIQDMRDLQEFPIQDYLAYLEYTQNPNGEDIETVTRFNQIVINLYKDKTRTDVEDYYQMWLALGIGESLGLKVKHKTEEFLQNAELVERIEHVYIDMIENYQDICS